jgi:hypothetical protein
MKEKTLTGIRYVVDEKGRKVAVQIDLKKHRQLWENMERVLISRSRRHGKRIRAARLKGELKTASKRVNEV